LNYFYEKLRDCTESKLSDSTLALILNKYSEPHRHYHTFNHIIDSLSKAIIQNGSKELCTAILFHDIIYDRAGSPSNEERSADFAEKILIECDSSLCIPTISKLILATGHPFKNEEWLHEQDLMIDIDFSGLGSPWENYMENERKIFKESISMGFSVEEYIIHRISFLKNMFAQKRLFNTEYFDKRYSLQAYSNIFRELGIKDGNLT
jgi:predicted metal-dependent HD superfamily phosphohydrolase